MKAYQDNRTEEEKESVKHLGKWDVVWFFCKNDNPKEPKDSYNRRTGVVYPGVDNKVDFIKLISTTGSFDGEDWKKPLLDPINGGFLSDKVWFNIKSLENHYRKGDPFYGVPRSQIIKKLGVLTEDDRDSIMELCTKLNPKNKKY